jgi:hypothetical protein
VGPGGLTRSSLLMGTSTLDQVIFRHKILLMIFKERCPSISMSLSWNTKRSIFHCVMLNKPGPATSKRERPRPVSFNRGRMLCGDRIRRASGHRRGIRHGSGYRHHRDTRNVCGHRRGGWEDGPLTSSPPSRGQSWGGALWRPVSPRFFSGRTVAPLILFVYSLQFPAIKASLCTEIN